MAVSSISAISYVPTPTPCVVAKRPSTANVRTSTASVQTSTANVQTSTANVKTSTANVKTSTANVTGSAQVVNEQQIAQANQYNKNQKLAIDNAKDSAQVSNEALLLLKKENEQKAENVNKNIGKMDNNDKIDYESGYDYCSIDNNGTAKKMDEAVNKFDNNDKIDYESGYDYCSIDDNGTAKQIDETVNKFDNNDKIDYDDKFAEKVENIGKMDKNETEQYTAINGNAQKPFDGYYPDMDRRGDAGTQTAEAANKFDENISHDYDELMAEIASKFGNDKQTNIEYVTQEHSQYNAKQSEIEINEELFDKLQQEAEKINSKQSEMEKFINQSFSRFAAMKAYC